MSRYDRQRRVRGYGVTADARLAELRVLLVGVGGIGAPLALSLVRAGVGALHLLDPDTVSEVDLARQILYQPTDAAQGVSKVEAARRELARFADRTTLEATAAALTPRHAAERIGAVDLVIDASDHLAVRFLIDQVCRDTERPWIHTAAISDRYTVIPFLSPGRPCFRCYLPQLPPAGRSPTCESDGVLPVSTALAAQHALSALWGWLSRRTPPRPGEREILRGQIGEGAPRVATLLPDPLCPGCSDAAEGSPGAPAPDRWLRPLCGRSRVEGWTRLEAAEVLARLRGIDARYGEWVGEERVGVLRAHHGEERLTVFPDGRLLFGPANDLDRARRRILELLGADALMGIGRS